MNYIIQKTDDEGLKTYFSDGTTRWTSEISKARQFGDKWKAAITALSITTMYELEVIEYE